MEVFGNPCPSTLQGAPAHFFMTLINTLLATQCSLKAPIMEDYGQRLKNGDEFDFIVIGAGSAGSVVANRLSEVNNWKVLILEAGGDPSVTTQIPSMLFSVQGTSEDWLQKTQPQEYSCQSYKNKQCRWGAGKVLGGCSSINAMLYVRGNSRDYDNWEKLGNTGWGFKNVLEYFKKSEDNMEFTSSYHGKNGYLKVNNFSHKNPIKKILEKATKSLGYPKLKDFHNGTNIGFGNAQGTVSEGTRYSTYKAFLNTVKDRSNLHVAKNAFVTKIIIDQFTKKATGVEVKIGDQILSLGVKKEVIVSAGAMKTPQILMLSGVGPKEHLKEMEIPLIKDLPVGQNLQDHLVYIGINVALREKQAKWAIKDQTPTEGINALYDYFMHKKGIFSTVDITNYMGFVDTLGKSEFPDIQYHHLFYNKEDPYLIKAILDAIGVNDDVTENIVKRNKDSALLNFWPTLLSPKSIGYLKLKSSDPFELPLIYSNYLKEDSDIETMLRAVKIIQKLLQTEAFAKHKPEIVDPKIPNCIQHEFLSDEYFKCSIRNMATTIYHYSGTAKMGPETDSSSVVDPRLRVHGIKSLRVADASIMPNIISGNTNAPCIMIGEKVSDMIKEDWGQINVNIKEEL